MNNRIKKILHRVFSKYTRKDKKILKNYIYTKIGSNDSKVREWADVDTFTELIAIDQTNNGDHTKLVTIGLGYEEMYVPEGFDPRCEMIAVFPAEISNAKFIDFYSMDVICWVATQPFMEKNWFAENRIVRLSKELVEIGPFCAVTFLKAKDKDGNNMRVEITKGQKVVFYYLVPLFQSELEYAEKHSENELGDLLLQNKDSYLFDRNRKPVI